MPRCGRTSASTKRLSTAVTLACLATCDRLRRQDGTRCPSRAKWKGRQPRPLRMERLERRPRQRPGPSSAMKATARATSGTGSRTFTATWTPIPLVDIGAGIEKGPWTADLFVKNLFDVRGQIVEGHPVPRSGLRRSGWRHGDRRQDLHDSSPARAPSAFASAANFRGRRSTGHATARRVSMAGLT